MALRTQRKEDSMKAILAPTTTNVLIVDQGSKLNEFDQVNFTGVYEGKTLMNNVKIKNVPWDVGHHQKVVQDALTGQPRGTLLDAGCGTGENAEFAASEGFQVTAIDFSSEAIQICKSRHKESHVDYQNRDIFDINHSWEEHFDTILDSAVYHAIPSADRLNYLTILESYLRPDGRLTLITFSPSSNGMPEKLAVPREQLETNLQKAGFTAISIKQDYYCGVYSTIEELIKKYSLEIAKNDAGESLLPVWVATATKK